MRAVTATMTILPCQKRHHEPHLLWDTPARFGGWQVCDGRARWPYTRPKPPSPFAPEYDAYAQQHGTVGISKGPVTKEWRTLSSEVLDAFPTLAEAFAYAQKLVNGRKKSL